MARRSREPGLWALFSSGGMVAAFVLPVLAGALWVATPLGWIEPRGYAEVHALAIHPLTRVFLFGVVVLALFHWAHRFRYTLYDGLQLYHLDRLIVVLTYGAATAGVLVSAYVLVTLP